MNKMVHKYIVSGAEKQYSFFVQDYKVRPVQKRRIEKSKHGTYRVTIGKNVFSGEVIHKKLNKYSLKVNGNTYHFLIDSEEAFLRKAAHAGMNGQDKVYTLRSSMPGKIVEVFVSQGSTVKKDEPLLILEAMKMQNQLLASGDAKVKTVYVQKGDTVLSDQQLIELERL